MKKILTIAVILFGSQAIAQTIVKSSIDSGGENVSNGNIQVLYTIGEVVVGENTSGNIILSEGFISSSTAIPLSANDYKLLNNFLLYPNPTYGKVYVKGDYTKIKKIETYSITGKKLLSLNSNFRQIDVSTFSSSVIFIKIITDKGSKTFKLIKR